ncbi:MAG: alpha-glucan family phosphorylase [Anaerolineae bacterium]|nr:alpha-glucan family phosphorylase [Anaerolineae bacterium]
MRPVATYTVVSAIPEPLQRLTELAYNIRWAWDHATIDLFKRMDPGLWEETKHNPVQMMGLINQDKLNALSRDDGFLAHLNRVLESYDTYMQQANRAWYAQEFQAEEQPLVAYFSFEFGLTESVPIYSGGLGMLAGDHLKAASDLGVPLVGVGLLYQQGYFRQYLNIDGWQQERYPQNNFYTMPIHLMRDEAGEPVQVGVKLPGRTVYAQVWRVQVGRVSLFLLDTNIRENPIIEDQDLTSQLYGGDHEMRIKQEILLGIGGLRALHALGMEPAVCHMNEGHSAFLALERAYVLMQRHAMTFDEALAVTSASNIFTTHTPVPAGNDYFEPELVEQYFEGYRRQLGLNQEDFLSLGRIDRDNPEEYFCMTILALRSSTYANGVSRLHGEVARKMWQDVYPGVPLAEVPIGSITNGVHSLSWVSGEMAGLYDRYLGPRWREDPADQGVWQQVSDIPSEELWRTHVRSRERLVSFVREQVVCQLEQRGAPTSEIDESGEILDPDALTIGFARRFATYKRATLLLRDPERLTQMMCSDRPVQFIFAGKAHPLDTAGKEFIREVVHFARKAGCRNRIIFLEDYDMAMARYLVQGVDVWMNTPRRPMEASGTSGMKATMNGVLNFSVLDGWWAESYRRDLGWAIGRGEDYEDPEQQDYIESNAIYEMLEKDLIPTFYDRGSDGLPRSWVKRMKAALSELCPVYSMNRVVQEYTRSYYRPALEQAARLAENGHEQGRAFAQWQLRLQNEWDTLQIGDVTCEFNQGEVHAGETLRVSAGVHLGHISPDSVSVQLYEGVLDADGRISQAAIYAMQPLANEDGQQDPGWYRYGIEYISEATGRHGYTVRIVPNYPELKHPLRLRLITWAAGENDMTCTPGEPGQELSPTPAAV